MKSYFRNIDVVTSLMVAGMLLPLGVFAQLKTVTTVTSPTQTTQLKTVTGISAPATSPTKTSTAQPLIGTTRTIEDIGAVGVIKAPTTGVSAPTTQTTKALSPTTGVIAPTLVAPTKTAQPSTGAALPTQKTLRVVPAPRTAPVAQPATAERYAAAQVIYQARNLAALQSAADASTDGEAEGLPLELLGIPGVPTVNVVAERGEGITFSVSGGGTYDIRGIVLDAESAALESFRDSVFTVVLDDYENLGAVAVLITYIPEETLTFAPGTGGIALPPPAGITPIVTTAPPAPITLKKPVAIAPVAPAAPETPSEVFELTLSLVALAPAPGEGGIVREIPSGEVPEEIISEEGEVLTSEDEGIPEDELELSTDEEPIEEPGIVERFGDFFGDLFGLAEAPEEVFEEEAPEEVSFEGEIAFEGDEAEAGVEEGEEEFFEGEPDEFFAFEGEPEEAPIFDFTDFGVSPDEFAGEEAVGDLGFGFDFGDLALAPEEEFAAEEEALPEEGVLGEEFFDGELTDEEEFFEGEPDEFFIPEEEFFAEEPFVEEEVGDLGLDFGDLALAPEEEAFVAEEEELLTPDLSAPVIPDYGAVGDDIVVTVSLDGMFDVEETPLVASLVFTPVAGGRGLEFSEPIDAEDVVTFNIPRSVLGVLGAEMRVLLKTTATLDGLLIVSTDVLGVARNE